MPGALEGFRVVDFSHHMAGPSATQRLGDLGADVIKIEPPGTGEWTRSYPISDVSVGELNSSFISLNRNKRSLAIDLKHPDSREVLAELVRTADVVVSNFRPRVNRRLGIDYETLSGLNPKIVYCAITAYGEEGPMVELPGQDLIVQSFAGIPWNGGVVDSPPVPAPVFVADSMCAEQAVGAILAALLHRERTGRGQKVSASLMAAAITLQTQELTTYLNGGRPPQRTHRPLAHPWINSPYGIHRTADGWLALAMTPFEKLGKALGSEVIASYRWSDGQTRRDEVYDAVAEVLRTKTTAQWLSDFQEHDVWAGPVQTYPELVENPQTVATGVWGSLRHPTEGEMRVVNTPVGLSETPAELRLPPARLGEHTAEILQELGFSQRRIEVLVAAGAVAALAEPAGEVAR